MTIELTIRVMETYDLNCDRLRTYIHRDYGIKHLYELMEWKIEMIRSSEF